MRLLKRNGGLVKRFYSGIINRSVKQSWFVANLRSRQSKFVTIVVRLRDGFLMAETCKVAVIWVLEKDDSHFLNFCHHL